MVTSASGSASGSVVSHVSAWRTINRLEHGLEGSLPGLSSFLLGFVGVFWRLLCVVVSRVLIRLHSCTLGVVLLSLKGRYP